MDGTPAKLFQTAWHLREAGQPPSTVVTELQAQGANDLDLVRVFMRVYEVGVGDARALLGAAGHPRFTEPLTVVVPEDDQWFQQHFGTEQPAD
jgi:hypothetical protein